MMTEKGKRSAYTLEFKLEAVRWYKVDTSIPPGTDAPDRGPYAHRMTRA